MDQRTIARLLLVLELLIFVYLMVSAISGTPLVCFSCDHVTVERTRAK